MNNTNHAQDEPERKAFEEALEKASQNDAEAQNSLAYCYSKGCGVAQDGKKAMEWWKKSAAQGCVNAELNLANCYHRGDCVKRNYKLAVKWQERRLTWVCTCTI